MKSVHIITIIGLGLLGASAGQAQQYLQPKWNGCITENGSGSGAKIFNNCTLSLSVQGISRDGSSAPWQIDIAAGGSQTDSWGTAGYELYVCPSGYYAVDGNGRALQTAATDYQCKKLD
jgi:hypothetical protein